MPAKRTADKKPTGSRAKKTAVPTGKVAPKKNRPKVFPVVALGASAGGLQALKSFFANVAADSGMSYIVVVHLTPKQPSMMATLLQNVTTIPVSPARDGQTVEPDHIYVIPPDKEISIYHGKIQLLDLVAKRSILPIDAFFRSLAQDQEARAAAVVLSGTGTDGSLGIKEIKGCDGLVLVQTEDSAEYDGMPRSAINSGVADMILPPDQMPKKLAQYFSHPKAAVQKNDPQAPWKEGKDWLNKIFAILRSQIGHDFSHYKVNTLLRRINRRMSLNQIADHDRYIRFLRETPTEVEALFRELLIGVTNFFRDPESFDILKAKVLPKGSRKN